MDTTTIQRYGDALHAALQSREAVAPLTDREPGITIADAYQIQLRMIQHRIDAGKGFALSSITPSMPSAVTSMCRWSGAAMMAICACGCAARWPPPTPRRRWRRC